MKNIIYIIVLVLFFFLHSCDMVEPAQNIDLPKNEQKIVVFSFISPKDSVVRVQIGKSKPLYGRLDNHETKLKNPVVTISDGVTTAILTEAAVPDETIKDPYYDQYTHFGYSIYESKVNDLQIVEGKTYYLTVEAEGQKVTGSCHVPLGKIEVVEIQTAKKSSTKESPFEDAYSDYNYTASFKFQDLHGHKNYYRISSRILYNEDTIYNPYDSSKFKIQEMASYVDFYKNFFSDEGNDGGMMQKSGDFNYFINENEGTWQVFLEIIDENYYKFLNSTFERKGNEDPFSEPTNVYSNIKGGLGVFAAYKGGRIQVKK